MMAAELEWFPLYVNDILTSRKMLAMLPEERGWYVLLLVHQWAAGPLPRDMDEMGALLGIDGNRMATAWRRIGRAFTEAEGGYVNERLEAVRVEQREKFAAHSRAGRAGAESRWAQQRNGNRITPPMAPPQRKMADGDVEEEKKQPSAANAAGGAAPDDKPEPDLMAARAEAFGMLKATWPGGKIPRSLSRDEFGEPWTPAREGSIWNNLVAHDPPGDVNGAIRVAIAKHPGDPFTLRTFQSSEPGAQEYYHQCLAEARKKAARGPKPFVVVTRGAA